MSTTKTMTPNMNIEFCQDKVLMQPWHSNVRPDTKLTFFKTKY